MTNQYRWVQWNRHKKIYDAIVVAAVVLYLAVFVGVGKLVFGSDVGDEILVMRALGTCAFAMLTLILCIGPAARFEPRLAAVLYNRRHLGVTMFLVALAHGVLALLYYGGFGVVNPFSAVFASSPYLVPLCAMPFELFGLLALLILFVMAATSHDFWLANLGAEVWKTLHMGVYLAFGLLVAHVALGALQDHRSPVYVVLVGGAVVLVGGLHVAAGVRERRRDVAGLEPEEGWVEVPSPREIPDGRARTVCLARGERVAVFRDGDELTAVTNVCAHQAGPLGEGKIVDGCITCPWHGYQFKPGDGCSPPPYTEKVATYDLRVEGERVLLRAQANEPGTRTTPVRLTQELTQEGIS